MKHEFFMPKLGLTMTEGLVAEWSVLVGASFTKGQTVYVVETDKAANEVASDAAGVLLEIVHAAGATVPVGDVIGYWEDGIGGEASNASGLKDDERMQTPSDSSWGEPILKPEPGKRLIATPLARRVAERKGIDLAQVRGTGPGGRIKVADLGVAQALTPQGVPIDAKPLSSSKWQVDGARIESSGVQLAMARRLTAAKQEVPHFYVALEADVGKLSALRADLTKCGKPEFTLNHYIVAAVGRALRDEPSANRIWFDDGLLQLSAPDVGMAVDTDRGLFAPVVRNAGQLSLSEIARQTQELIERARAGKLSGPEMSGGAITVSNAGKFNVTYLTPIINPGQAMILGVGSVRKIFRPNEQGLPMLCAEMNLVLACDHRVLDGASGIRFLNRVRGYLEQPLALLV